MKLIFLTYINRSGSTLLANEISKHRSVCIIPEADVLVRKLLKYPEKKITLNYYFFLIKTLGKNFKYSLWTYKPLITRKIVGKTCAECFIEICTLFAGKTKPEASYILFKSTLFPEIIPRLKRILDILNIPSYYIALIRDPRAIFNSQLKTISPRTSEKMNTPLPVFAKSWNRYVQKVIQQKDIQVYRYEDLILNHTNIIGSIYSFLNLEISDSFINQEGDVMKLLSEEYKQIHINLCDPPKKENIDKWKSELPIHAQRLIELYTKRTLSNQNYLINNYLLKHKYIAVISGYFDVFIFKLHYVVKKCIKRNLEFSGYILSGIKRKVLAEKFLYGAYCMLAGNFYSFKDVKTFCVFIGYPRSGHTLIGAMLDAHPNMVIGIEANIIPLIKRKWKRKQLFYYITRRSKLFVKVYDAIWKGYNYRVPGQFQGEWTNIHIIGDKKAGKTSRYLTDNYELLTAIQKTVQCKLKIIHVVRNPYDVIATMTKKSSTQKKDFPVRLQESINEFFNNAYTNHHLIDTGKFDIYTIFHEELISNPKQELIKLLDFLNINYTTKYIEACISVINQIPHESRKEIEWPDRILSQIDIQVQKITFLKKYINSF